MYSPKQYRLSLADQDLVALGYHEDQQGTPIILVHGLLVNVYTWWLSHVGQFAEFGPVYSIALGGHFPSEFKHPFKGTLDQDALADMLEMQIAKLVGDRPVKVVGHSTGALAMFCLALKYPGRVESMVCMSTCPHGREEGGMFGFFQWLHLRLGALGSQIFRLIVKANAVNFTAHKFLLHDTAYKVEKLHAYPQLDDYIRFYLPAMKRLDYRAMGHYFRDLASLDLTDQLSQIHQPVLLMYADHDPYTPTAAAQTIYDHLGSADKELVIIQNSGHMFMFEAHEQYEAAILPWLEAHR